ncbi:MAG: DUF1254 domain-containing protein [Pseudomonadota bacterium]
MKGWIGPLLLGAATALGSHFAVLALAPSVIMDQALSGLAKRNIALHAFTNPERITPETQVVVRSSPDLFYALCRYDLSAEGSSLAITMGEWPGYQSLSFFDAETNNFFTQRGVGASVEVSLIAGGKGLGSVTSPTNRGVVLIRRLAPTQELFDQALQVAQSDACEYIAR